MKKKITSLILSAALAILPATAAFAQTAVSDGGNITIPADAFDSDAVLVAGYSADGVLCGARYVVKGENGFVIEEIAGAATYRAGEISEDSFVTLEITAESETGATAEPETTAEPQTTVTPAATTEPTAAPTGKTEYPSIYEKEKDAVYTIAVVDTVSYVTDDNNEAAYSVDVLIRGEEETFVIPSDVKIVTASDYYSYLQGSDASVLKKGDVVYFEKSLRGKFTAMSFITRPVTENIVTSDTDYGTNFEKLFASNGVVYAGAEKGAVIPYGSGASGRYQFAYGVVVRKDGSSITLYNKAAKGKDAIEIDIQSDTIVYVCDTSAKNEVTVTKASGIAKSSIPKSAFDDDDNITEYTDDYVYNYALARVVNGTATEVVLYTNYND